MLTDQLPQVEVFTLMSVSGVDDSSDPTSGMDFKSRNEDCISVSEVPMLTPAELVALPKGQALPCWRAAAVEAAHAPARRQSGIAVQSAPELRHLAFRGTVRPERCGDGQQLQKIPLRQPATDRKFRTSGRRAFERVDSEVVESYGGNSCGQLSELFEPLVPVARRWPLR